jgi:thiamine kinase-like enzyme
MAMPDERPIVNLEECLPVDLRAPTTTITRIAVGLSGAGVYRVDAHGELYVLKISGDGEPLAEWNRRRNIQQIAADAGLAPRVVHADEPRRAVLTAYVVDRSFPALYWNPATRDAALTHLGHTIRRVHELPLPANSTAKNPRELLVSTWAALAENFAVPAFVSEAVQRIVREDAPPRERDLVLSHNDINPTNLAYDGEHLLLLDWDTAGPNDPWYDLAAVSVFLRMDEGICQRLIAAYDDAPVSDLSAGFEYNRRLVAILCGVVFLRLARQSGHPGATGGETLESTLSLSEFYQQLRSGALSPATAEGQWAFGLSLVKEGVSARATS